MAIEKKQFADDDPFTLTEDHGAVFLYLGRTKRSPMLFQLKNGAGVSLGSPGTSISSDAGIAFTGNASDHRSALQLVWEIAPYGSEFDGTRVFKSIWGDSGNDGYLFEESFTVEGDANGWLCRARVLYAPLGMFTDVGGVLKLKTGLTLANNPPHGPWYYPQWATEGPSEFRTGPIARQQIRELGSAKTYSIQTVVFGCGQPEQFPRCPAEADSI